MNAKETVELARKVLSFEHGPAAAALLTEAEAFLAHGGHDDRALAAALGSIKHSEGAYPDIREEGVERFGFDG